MERPVKKGPRSPAATQQRTSPKGSRRQAIQSVHSSAPRGRSHSATRGAGIGRSPHPGVERLIDLAEGRLTVPVVRRLHAHFESCPECEGLELAFRRLMESLLLAGRDAPPSALSHWAGDLPDQVPTHEKAGRSRTTPATLAAPRGHLGRGLRGVRTGLMRLVADSWALSARVSPTPLPRTGLANSQGGLRSGAADGAGPSTPLAGRRRLLLSAAPFDLDLQVDYRGASEARRVHGQILPIVGSRRAWQGSEVRLISGRRTVTRVRVDRRGEFALPRVLPGVYRIAVSAGPAKRAARSTSPRIEV